VSPRKTTSSRIAELDGIRGLAAILVLVFHVLAAGRVSGGVDVLIFLSGFFFATILLKDSSRLFPQRLITYTSRLLPVAALVLVVILVLALADLSPKPTRTLLTEILFSALMLENWFLGFQATDYLANDGWQSMVQHFWAVSVQVQLFALFLLATHFVKLFAKSRWVRWQWVSLGTLSGLSLVYSAWISSTDPTFAYFDTFARAWEFGAGAMVGLLGLAFPKWLETIRFPLASLGVVLILATGIFVPSQGFPFPSALVPIAGITLFTLGAMRQRDSFVRKVFRTPPARFIGSMSYPIYLWHWPIHVMVSELLGNADTSFLLRLVVISALTFFFSWATARTFEGPILAVLRAKPNWQLSWLTGAVIGSLALSSIAVNSVIVSRDQDRFGAILNPDRPPQDDKELDPITYESFKDVKNDNPISYSDGCHLGKGGTKIRQCVYGDPNGEKTIFLVGGSHAANWQPALDKASLEMGWRLIYATKSACLLTFGDFDALKQSCEQWNRNVVKLIKDERPDLVISTSTLTTSQGRELIPRGYIDAWDEFSTYGIEFFMIRDIPRWEGDPVDCVERFPSRFNEKCVMKASDRMADEDPTLAIRDDYPNFTFVDFTDAVCPGGTCRARDKAGFPFRDKHHFTKSFSESLHYLFLPELELRTQID
jgi:peptidoglycan/LPS O-acetylase OafA/YrhL